MSGAGDVISRQPAMAPRGKLVSPAFLRLLLEYDPMTGIFLWKARPVWMFPAHQKFSAQHLCNRWNAEWAEAAAFTSTHSGGYKVGSINGMKLFAHRVAWAVVAGEWPTLQIDHINGRRADNRIVNLREVTAGDNAKNKRLSPKNTSGVLGVAQLPSKRWMAQVGSDGQQQYLGSFETIEEAKAARERASRELGFHPNHGAF